MCRTTGLFHPDVHLTQGEDLAVHAATPGPGLQSAGNKTLNGRTKALTAYDVLSDTQKMAQASAKNTESAESRNSLLERGDPSVLPSELYHLALLGMGSCLSMLTTGAVAVQGL